MILKIDELKKERKNTVKEKIYINNSKRRISRIER
jgi:hypothetical protein